MRTVRRFHIQENGVLYPSENGMVCYYMDVERLEAKCAELEAKCAELEAKGAELLEAAEKVAELFDNDMVERLFFINKAKAYHLGMAVDQARAAIAKAKGEQP